MTKLIISFLKETGFSESEIVDKFDFWMDAFGEFSEESVSDCFLRFLKEQGNFEKPTISNVLKRMREKEIKNPKEDVELLEFFDKKTRDFNSIFTDILEKNNTSIYGGDPEFIEILLEKAKDEFLSGLDNDEIKKLEKNNFF